MDGFFEILMLVVMIWAFSRGAKKKRPTRPPGADAEESGGQEPLDWDKAIGDVLEGFGLQRPKPGEEEQRPPPGVETPSRYEVEARRRIERARQMKAQRAEARRGTTRKAERSGWELRDATAEAGRGGQRAPGSDLAEIAGLAEAAARRRSGLSKPSAPLSATRRGPRDMPEAEASHVPEELRPAAARSASSGLQKLEALSEMERAIVYAEILGRPKALRLEDEADS